MKGNPKAATGEIVVVGFGSIGRRHVRNLRHIGWNAIGVVHTGRSSLPLDELEGTTVYRSTVEAFATSPKAVIVANPTSMHLETAIEAAREGAHLLVEKPISDRLKGVHELAEEAARRSLVAMVGFQFRLHPTLRVVREWIAAGRLGDAVSARARWGEYLPAWHPWEDHRAGYAARRDLGGGVVNTLCHPLDYLLWMLGPVERVAAVTSRRGLGLEVEDSALIQLSFRSGALGCVDVDYLRKPTRHDLEIVGQERTAAWDALSGRAEILAPDGGVIEAVDPSPGFERNDMFLDELRHFLSCVESGEVPCCPLADGISVLRLTEAAHRAALENRCVELV